MLSNIVLLLAQLLWSERDGVMFLRAWTPSSLLPSPLSVCSLSLPPPHTLSPPCTHTDTHTLSVMGWGLFLPFSRPSQPVCWDIIFWGVSLLLCSEPGHRGALPSLGGPGWSVFFVSPSGAGFFFFSYLFIFRKPTYNKQTSQAVTHACPDLQSIIRYNGHKLYFHD